MVGPMRASLGLAVLLLALGCDRSPSSGAPSAAPRTSPAAQAAGGMTSASATTTASATGPVGAVPGDVSGAKPGPLVLPKIVLPNGSVPIHASLLGWSADGR